MGARGRSVRFARTQRLRSDQFPNLRAVGEQCSEHRKALRNSDGVLLLWGTADPEWYAETFADMSKLANRAISRGVCLFDPKQNKSETLRTLQRLPAIHTIPQFDGFDPVKLESFLEPLRK